MAGILKIITGALEAAGGVALDVFAGGAGGLGNMLIGAGVGTIVSGIGSMISGNPQKGFSTTARNPIAPWTVGYGQLATGGTLVYLNEWGASNVMLDMVVILEAHTCQSVDELLFDQQRVQIDTTAIPTSAKAGFSIPTPVAGSGTSFSPVQQAGKSAVPVTAMSRTNDVVTVSVSADIPFLTAGDQITSQGVNHGISGSDQTFNGVFPVAQITNAPSSHVGGPVGTGALPLTFTFISGGTASTPNITAGPASIETMWADYGRNVYVEFLTGGQTLGETFVGMTAGTPWQGTGKLVTPASPLNAGGTATNNPWTANCSLLGKTAAHIRLQYDKTKFPAGLPQISFRLTGKNDIYDPRTGTYGYTNNAALCIADFLNQGDPTDGRNRVQWGFKANYSSSIPATFVDGSAIDRGLSAMANICDSTVALVTGGSEPMYTCNGQFNLSMKRGEIMQNMLTSCAGRLSYVGGQYFIQPGHWFGPGATPLAVNLTNIATGRFKWKPSIGIRDVYNGCKGTYVSPENKWQSTDYPPYCQDTDHGYSGPSAYNGDILLGADGGDRRWLELHLPFTTSSGMAQRIAKIELLRRRGRSGTMVGTTATAGYCGNGTFPLNLAGYQFMPLDVFEATIAAPLNFSGKLLEVTATRFNVSKKKKAVLLSTEIEAQETDSSIYAWSTTEQLSPQGFVQSNYPTGTFQETYPFPWSPGYVAPLAGDAIGGPATFGLQLVPGVDAQGNANVQVQIKGTAPINSLDSGIAAPLLSCAGNATGGTIPIGEYVLGLTAYDSGSSTHEDTDYHSLVHVVITAATGSITGTVTWGSGDDGGDVYMGIWTPNGYVMHYQQTLSPGATSFSITSFNQSTAGGVDTLFDHFGVLPFAVEHSGVWDGQIPDASHITSSTVTIGAPTTTANQYASYVLSLLGRLSGEVPPINLPIASNAASVGDLCTFTIGAGIGGTLPNLTTILQSGDLLVMRGRYTFTANSFTDTNTANSFFPTGGDTTVEPGHVAIVLSGADAGDMKTIKSITADMSGNFTVFNISDAWNITPTTGDMVVICSPAGPEWPTPAVTAANGSVSGVMAQMPVPNDPNSTWLFLVRTDQADGSHGVDSMAPMRDVYCGGVTGTLPFLQFTVDGNLAIQSDAAPQAFLPADRQPSGVMVSVKSAPTGAALSVSLWAGSSKWMSLTIATGTTSVTATTAQIQAAGAIPANTNLRLSIDGVGSTNPSSGLSLMLYR